MNHLPASSGSSLWSQGADSTFRLVSCVFFLIFLCYCVSAQRLCRKEEYPVGDECCPMCNPGYHVKRACSVETGTVCAPCPPETYTAHANGLSMCLPCGVCDPDMNLVTWQECSSRNDTVCRCSPGYFCKTQEGDHCSVCLPHTNCSRGQRVQKRGTYSQDTVCADCLTGTFSTEGTQEECLPWTKCKALIEKEAEHGTSSTDVTCSISPGFITILCILCSPVIAVPLFLIWKQRRRLHISVRSHTLEVAHTAGSPDTGPEAGEQEPFQGQNTVGFPVTEVGPAVTEEGTALNPLNREDSG
ncbi:tumor necrosis factor receptor superfamily member 14 [Acomys russatus]|uniref:tumor necrosis factor receptor superfamily member 14 n=1 Tax=Acomys russatus TaxID=60746 RepID=UPI0021E22048|nr:tumor necrosis factor receptor superfamily member 14 [Acomys russatus]